MNTELQEDVLSEAKRSTHLQLVSLCNEMFISQKKKCIALCEYLSFYMLGLYQLKLIKIRSKKKYEKIYLNHFVRVYYSNNFVRGHFSGFWAGSMFSIPISSVKGISAACTPSICVTWRLTELIFVQKWQSTVRRWLRLEEKFFVSDINSLSLIDLLSLLLRVPK